MSVIPLRHDSNLTNHTQVPVLCSGSLFYRIKDSYKACFEVSEVEKNISNIGMSAVRSVLGTFTYDQVRRCQPDIHIHRV
jgi:regulator of protease activity HflC (stomatin/prohibitin superfamily)